MAQNTLIVNPGSSSRKYAFFEGKQQQAEGKFELSGNASIRLQDEEKEYTLTDRETTHTLSFFMKESNIPESGIDLIGLRVVAPGDYFQENKIMNEVYIKKLRTAMEVSPLHISKTLQEYGEIQQIAPYVPVVAISDSAFHRTIPETDRLCPINYRDAYCFGLKKYGYHGISLQSILRQLHEKEEDCHRMIVCHLGSGSSITAIRDGESVDTSMGFSPLSGITMATRPGDLDPELVIYLWEKKKWNTYAALHYFNEQCGLMGITGDTGDLRTILHRVKKQNGKAITAFTKYVHDIKKAIGAYMATLNGLDLLIFTGGVGENAPEVRHGVCSEMESLGIKLDQKLNAGIQDGICFIHDDKSTVKIAVVPTKEEEEMLRQIYNITKI